MRSEVNRANKRACINSANTKSVIKMLEGGEGELKGSKCKEGSGKQPGDLPRRKMLRRLREAPKEYANILEEQSNTTKSRCTEYVDF